MSQDILITPKGGEPQILFRGSGTTDTPIVLNVLSSYQSATGSGTAVVFEGTEGQLFGVSDNLSSGTIFSVSDITGLPSIEFLANGELKLGEFGSGVNIYNTNLGMTLATHSGAATHIPAFVEDPASGVTRLGFRTAAQIRSDIGAGTGNGSVTSVATNNGVTGGTITTTGTIGLTGNALSLHNLATNGVIARTAANTVTARTITGTANQVTVTNGDGVAGNPTLSLPQNIHTAATPTFGATTINGNLEIRAAATATTSTQIPVFIADPSATTRTIVTRTPAQLRSDIGAGTGNGTVTSIATNNGIVGGTITTTGTLGLTGQALALHNLATNGLIARTGADTVTGRTITGTTNRVTVTNGDGVAGNPTLTLPQDIHTAASPTFGGGTLNGALNLRASATGVAATQIPVFTADPTSTTRLLVTRTPAQILSDIGAQAALTNPVTGTGANGQVSFWTSSSTQSGDNGLRWDNTNKRLGIGTTDPSRLLEVVGGSNTSETALLQVRSNFTGNDTASAIRFANSTDASAGNGAVELVAIRTNAAVGGDSDFVIRTAAGATLNERVRVTSNGRVGINTNTPAQALHIQGNGARIRMSTSSNPGLYRFDIESNFNAGDTINFYGTDGFNFLKWIYTTSALCLNPNGGVLGVGTTSPASRFHLNTVTAASTGVIIRGSASQSADLQQWQDSTATALASVSSVGNFSLRAPATGVAATQIPVFTADPASTTRLLVTRTPAQLRSDIGAGTGNGTVTSIATNNGLTGGTITTTGTLGLTGQALALHNLATNGLIARTGAGTVAGRTITGTANRVTVTNGDGVAGNPTLTLPQDIHTAASPTFGGGTLNGALNLRASATGVAATQIPVFTADPASTTRLLVTRTPEQLRGDMNGVASIPVTNASGVTNIMVMSEATYNALSPKNANTLYFLT